MNRLDATFARLREQGELGLFPYLMTGFPSPAACAELLDALAEGGADGIELGVPFSDPLADGATLQRVGAAALQQGGSIEMALDLLRGFRPRHQAPILLMSYLNPILAYGPDRLARVGAEAGLDGLIVPDLPIEEAEVLRGKLDAAGLHLINLVAPTSTADRMASVARTASGFIYCVALIGVTGARSSLSDELPAFLARVRRECPQPLVVGFGISQPEHVAGIRGQADGVIVGGALADLIETTPPAEQRQAVRQYVSSLKEATLPIAKAPGPS